MNNFEKIKSMDYTQLAELIVDLQKPYCEKSSLMQCRECFISEICEGLSISKTERWLREEAKC